MKISIIGAGNVGATLAERILTNALGNVVLLDVQEGLAKAKALDLRDAEPIVGYKNSVCGTSDYKETEGSDIVVITAGLARKPGMSRDDLIDKNSNVVRSVARSVKVYSKNAIIIVVTNPLDVMTYVAKEEFGEDRFRVIGMAGNLDTARFKSLLSEECNVSSDRIKAFVLGSHGDTMVPLTSKAEIDGKPISQIMSKERVDRVVERTKKRGGEIVGLMKTGSAFYSPSAACLEIIKAIVFDEDKEIVCSCALEGEYGIDGCATGVPTLIGKNGISEVLEWTLTDEEKTLLKKSAHSAKSILERKERQCKRQID